MAINCSIEKKKFNVNFNSFNKQQFYWMIQSKGNDSFEACMEIFNYYIKYNSK